MPVNLKKLAKFNSLSLEIMINKFLLFLLFNIIKIKFESCYKSHLMQSIFQLPQSLKPLNKTSYRLKRFPPEATQVLLKVILVVESIVLINEGIQQQFLNGKTGNLKTFFTIKNISVVNLKLLKLNEYGSFFFTFLSEKV